MSLFTSLQVAKNSLLVAQLGLQVTGNNIANASTPGYLRQELVLTSAPTHRKGDLLLGMGVQVDRIKQQVDKFLEERLRGANSDLMSSETQEKVYQQLEGLISELGDSDVSTSLTSFFNAVSEVLNQPESRSVRNLVVLQGDVLARTINRLDSRTRELRSDLNERVIAMADAINGHLEEIARLNVQIVASEGGGARKSDAVGLRDRRLVLLGELSRMTDVKVSEQESGAMTVFAGGEYLVFDGNFRAVDVDFSFDRGVSVAQLKLAETDSPISSTSGELSGLVIARDDLLGGFLDQFDELTRALVFEFNKVHAQGQGLVGFQDVTSLERIANADAPLDQAGLNFTPNSGMFSLLMRNKQTGMTTTTEISIELNGLDTDTSLNDLVAQLTSIDGLTATVTTGGELRLKTDSKNLEFAFQGDTSGVLAALGLNTFFGGATASDIGINDMIRNDPALYAASRGGIGEDTENGVELAALIDAPLASQGGASLADMYRRTVTDISQASAVSRSVAEGFRVFQKTLEGDQLAVSGVSIDEEAIRMISYQRMFQMSARYVATVSEMLDALVRL